MTLKKHGPKLATILLLVAVLLSACNQSVSTAPAKTSLATPTGAFVTPQAGAMSIETLAEFGRQTAQAQTAAAAGGTATTPQPVAIGTVTTPQVGTPATPTNVIVVTSVVPAATTPVVVTPGGPIPTSGPRPASYTLQAGEFPYCIARRFNVNPDELLNINGLTNGQIYYPNLTLKIPQTGNPFPASRALQAHPATYTVFSTDETVYGVACKYGDVDPAAIAAANGISVAAKLTVGQKLSIP